MFLQRVDFVFMAIMQRQLDSRLYEIHSPSQAFTTISSDCSKFMRTECLNNRYVFDTPLPINRLVAMVGSKSQIPTQRYGRRPFGVGLLVAGYDVSVMTSLNLSQPLSN